MMPIHTPASMFAPVTSGLVLPLMPVAPVAESTAITPGSVDELRAFARVVRHEAAHVVAARLLGFAVVGAIRFADNSGETWWGAADTTAEDCLDSATVIAAAAVLDRAFGYGVSQGDADGIAEFGRKYQALTGESMPDAFARAKSQWGDPRFDAAFFGVCRLLTHNKSVTASQIDAVLGFVPTPRVG